MRIQKPQARARTPVIPGFSAVSIQKRGKELPVSHPIRHGTNGAEWHSVALQRDYGAAQVLERSKLVGRVANDLDAYIHDL